MMYHLDPSHGSSFLIVIHLCCSGAVIGESEKKTHAILHESEGCVLVIDEAYGLAPANKGSLDPYKEAVINELVATIQNVPGEDRAVLLLGYKDEMKEMLNNCNPGTTESQVCPILLRACWVSSLLFL